MPLHLVKLCVGVSAVEELQAWVDEAARNAAARGEAATRTHTTRMFPRREAELLDGGSLYWVIKGKVQARQRLVDLCPVTGKDGINRCRIVMEARLVLTEWQPRRAFQGWRYLKADDAPADLNEGSGIHALPPELRIQLANLGLL